LDTVQKWKAGDVAVSIGDRLIRTSEGKWSSQSGQSGIRYPVQEPRPLAVIDYEDREQVERLSSLIEANGGPYFGEMQTAALQAALREFAAPTAQIEEPTGLGAVVEDAEGEHWVRWALASDDRTSPWRHADHIGAPAHRRWDALDVVKVLSEGVSA
jgi:hypothetical protein